MVGVETGTLILSVHGINAVNVEVVKEMSWMILNASTMILQEMKLVIPALNTMMTT
jgi:hypothetical protein